IADPCRRRRAPADAALAAGAADEPQRPRRQQRKPAPARPQALAGAEGGARLQGNLAQTPLHDVLQYLSLGRKSGILEVTSGRRAGRIVLRDGRVCKSSYRGKEAMEAAFLLMDLPDGDFEFYEQALEDPASHPAMEVVDIIMLWMDRK